MDIADTATSSRPSKRRKQLHHRWSDPCCCSSNNETTPSSTESTQSSGLTKEMIIIIADLEDENSSCDTDCRDINCSQRRERTAESGGMEGTTRAVPEKKSAAAVETMPSEAELEEFFSAAEKQIHKQFQDKYNFDVTKELPLEGRYEWVQIKP